MDLIAAREERSPIPLGAAGGDLVEQAESLELLLHLAGQWSGMESAGELEGGGDLVGDGGDDGVHEEYGLVLGF